MEDTNSFWRKCSTCKKQIGFGSLFWVCNVTSCNKKRAGFVFCSVDCWDHHVPVMNHRTSWAEERHAPSKADITNAEASNSRPPGAKKNPFGGSDGETEILVIASKLKAYIKRRYDKNTSASALEAISDFIRVESNKAIEKARADGRKTVFDRDFE